VMSFVTHSRKVETPSPVPVEVRVKVAGKGFHPDPGITALVTAFVVAFIYARIISNYFPM